MADDLINLSGYRPMTDHMAEAMSDQIGPRLDAIGRLHGDLARTMSMMLERFDALEKRLEALERWQRSLVIPVSEYLPRG